MASQGDTLAANVGDALLGVLLDWRVLRKAWWVVKAVGTQGWVQDCGSSRRGAYTHKHCASTCACMPCTCHNVKVEKGAQR